MMHRMSTADDVLGEAEAVLKASGAVEHPHVGKERFDALELLSFVLGEEPEPAQEVPAVALRRTQRTIK